MSTELIETVWDGLRRGPTEDERIEACTAFERLIADFFLLREANGGGARETETLREALRKIRQLAKDGHADDLVAETADSALASSPEPTRETETLRAALAAILAAYVSATEHITEDLQPEFERLAEDGRLTWPEAWSSTPYDESQAAWRLATWWHGVGTQDVIDQARAALAGSPEQAT